MSPMFPKGHCLNCGTPIVYGILCFTCTPPDPSTDTVVHAVRVSEMAEGQTGYIEAYSLFEVEGLLYVIGTSYISATAETYKTVKIKRNRGMIEVDGDTLDIDDVWQGWPDMSEEADFIIVKLLPRTHRY